MRILTQVLEAMLAQIPVSEENVELRKQLEDLRASAAFASPEVMTSCWQRGQNILIEFLPPDTRLNEWQIKVVRIWMDKDTASKEEVDNG